MVWWTNPSNTFLWPAISLQCCGKNFQSGAMVEILTLNPNLRYLLYFGDWERKDCLLLFNHIILIAKQYIYYCRTNNFKPLFIFPLLRIKSVYQLECRIDEWKDKWQAHSLKWSKCGFEDEQEWDRANYYFPFYLLTDISNYFRVGAFVTCVSVCPGVCACNEVGRGR